MVHRAFFKRWEVEHYRDADISIPLPRENEPTTPSVAAAGAAAHDDFYLRDIGNTRVIVSCKIKALTMEAVRASTVTLTAGAIATVQLCRCERVRLVLDGPVAAVRIDDCNDVTLVLSPAARRGFLEQLHVRIAAPSSSSQPLQQAQQRPPNDTSPDSPLAREANGQIATTQWTGFHLYTTGSHAVTLD
jgi:hypothetical protein